MDTSPPIGKGYMYFFRKQPSQAQLSGSGAANQVAEDVGAGRGGDHEATVKELVDMGFTAD